MSRVHAAAIKSALTAAGLTVYDGGPPANPAYPYVGLYTDAGRPIRANLRGQQNHSIHTFQTTTCGTDHEQVLWAAEKVRTALAGVRMTVSGFDNEPVENIMSSTVGTDYDGPTNVRTKFDQWRYLSVPTT